MFEPYKGRNRVKDLEKKLKEIQEQRDELQLKINTISHESTKAKRFNSVLVYDNQILFASVEKNFTIEKTLDVQLKDLTLPRTSVVSRPSVEPIRSKHTHANSNPLDYADVTPTTPHIDIRPEFAEDFCPHEENDVSEIMYRYEDQEMLGDSVLMDCLKL